MGDAIWTPKVPALKGDYISCLKTGKPPFQPQHVAGLYRVDPVHFERIMRVIDQSTALGGKLGKVSPTRPVW
jgi:hypothetical protein